jgi:hypothetical protein
MQNTNRRFLSGAEPQPNTELQNSCRKEWTGRFMRGFGFGNRARRLRGWLPPNPRLEKKDRCAGEDDLLGAKPAPTLAVPQVSPPTSPTSWARHAPCWRFGVEAPSTEIVVFGGREHSFRCITTRQKDEKFENSGANLECSFSLDPRNPRNLTSVNSVESRFAFSSSSCSS